MSLLGNVTGLVKSIAGKPVTQALTAAAALNPVTAVSTIVSAVSKKPETTIKQVQGTTAASGIIAGIATGVATKSVGAGAAVSSLAGSAATASYLETAPKTSSIVQKVEKTIGTSVESIAKKVTENPVESLLIAATAPILVAAAVKTGGNIIKGTSAGTAEAIITGGQSSLDTPTDIIGLKPSKDGGLLGSTDLQEEKIKEKPLSQDLLPTSAFLSVPATETADLTQAGKLTPILSRKAYKRRKAKEPIKVSQRVNIAIKNSNRMSRNIYKVSKRY